MSRPPKVDEYRRYAVVAANQQEAVLVAQQMAACTSVMPVYSEWESSHRAGPVDPFGAMDCSCWALPWSEDVSQQQDEMDVPYGRPPKAEPVWQLNEACPWHGTPPLTSGPRPPVGVGVGANGFLCRKHGVDDCFCSGPPDYTIATATGAIVPVELRRKPPCTCGNPDGPHISGADSLVCTPNAPEPQDVPHLCETSRCWQDCRDRTDAANDTVVGLMSPGRVACRWCPWSTEYADEIGGYRDLVAHWASGACNKGDDECNSASPPKPTWRRRLRGWIPWPEPGNF